MASITYTNKDKSGTGAVKQWRDVDANEVKTAVNSKQDALGFTPENASNKVANFDTVNNTQFPTTQAVADYVAANAGGGAAIDDTATATNKVWSSDKVAKSVLDSSRINIKAITAGVNTRNDAPSFVKLSNGNWMCAYTAYRNFSTDADTCDLKYQISTDNRLTWGAAQTIRLTYGAGTSPQIPSLFKRADGSVYCLFLKASSTSVINKIEYNTGANTWGTETTIYGDDTKYYIPRSNVITKLSNGLLVYPLAEWVAGSDHSSGNTTSTQLKFLVSSNDGVAWTLATGTLTLSNGTQGYVAFEPKVFEVTGRSFSAGVVNDDDGVYVAFRTLNSFSYKVKLTYSGTDITAVGTPYPWFPAHNSWSDVTYYAPQQVWIAVRNRYNGSNTNTAQRKDIDLIISRDFVNWASIYLIDSEVNYQFTEPVFEIDTNSKELYVAYSRGNTASTEYDLIMKQVPLHFIHKDRGYDEPKYFQEWQRTLDSGTNFWHKKKVRGINDFQVEEGVQESNNNEGLTWWIKAKLTSLYYGVYHSLLKTVRSSYSVRIDDISLNGNTTYDDTGTRKYLTVRDNATDKFTILMNGAMIYNNGLGGLTDAADDSAAATAGVPLYGQYRTGSILKVRVS